MWGILKNKYVKKKVNFYTKSNKYIYIYMQKLMGLV